MIITSKQLRGFMSYMRHNAVLVTSFSKKLIEQAHIYAVDVFGDVTSIVESKVNGYLTFLVPPDGSKEGWKESNEGNEQRDKFITWLHSQAYEDRSNPFSWVEVQYGDDELETIIVRDSDEDRRKSTA